MMGRELGRAVFARSLAWIGVVEHGWAAGILRHERLLAATFFAGVAVLLLALHHDVVAQRAVFAGCVVLAGGWLFARWRLGRILGPEESVQRLGAPLYAAAPVLSERFLRQLPPDRRTASDFVVERPDAPYSAVFRRLSAVACGRMPTRSLIVAVTAPRLRDGGPGEALTLARTMAGQGKRVIMLDCDIRLQSLTRLVGLRPAAGIWEVLCGEVGWRAVLQRDARSSAMVLCAAGGARDHRELFDTARFSNLLSELSEAYDAVILSCPSTLGRAATMAIVRHATVCVLVVQWAKSPMRHVRAALKVLRNCGLGAQAGLLLTEVPQAAPFGRHMRQIA
jgi:Mrp family chromosome partitioning ATPase